MEKRSGFNTIVNWIHGIISVAQTVATIAGIAILYPKIPELVHFEKMDCLVHCTRGTVFYALVVVTLTWLLILYFIVMRLYIKFVVFNPKHASVLTKKKSVK